jgi:acylphosphatase
MCELMTDKVRASVVVSGKVQGVFFRAKTKETAAHYGVFGWVKNNSDGTVEAIFEGDEDDVKAVIEWCRQGPPHSRVKNVTVIYEDYSGKFTGFDITY